MKSYPSLFAVLGIVVSLSRVAATAQTEPPTTVLGPGWVTLPAPEMPNAPELLAVPGAVPLAPEQMQNIGAASSAAPPPAFGESESTPAAAAAWASSAPTPPESTPGVPAFVASAATDADTGSAEITALAEGLGKDPVAAFNWVRDNIRYVHYLGCKKGARLTFLERAGNDVDTCSLLMALLRACSTAQKTIQAGYVRGWQKIPFAVSSAMDAARWLGIYNANQVLRRFMAGGNVFGSTLDYNILDGVIYFYLPRVWLQVSVGADPVRYLDPSFKICSGYLPSAGLEIYAAENGLKSPAVNYSRDAMLAAAGITGAASGTSVENVNAASLNNYLRDRSAGLQSWLKTDAARFSFSPVETLGGVKKVPLAGLANFNSTDRFCFDIVTSVNGVPRPAESWPAGVPDSQFATLTIINTSPATSLGTVRFAMLAGKKLTLTFATDGAGTFKLDDTTIPANYLASVAAGSGAVTLTFRINHPSMATAQETSMTFKRDSMVSLVYAFDASGEMVASRQQQLEGMRQQGKADAAPEMITESLNLLGHQWFRQTELMLQMLHGASEKDGLRIHRFGRVVQDNQANGGYYIDVGMQTSSEPVHRTNYSAVPDNSAELMADHILASAMEHGIIEQLQPGTKAASTVKLVANNNAVAGKKTFLATQANSAGMLGEYSASEQAIIQGYLNTKHTVILPQSGSIAADPAAAGVSWKGSAYMISRYGQVDANNVPLQNQAYMLIGGTWQGGYGSVTGSYKSTQYLNTYVSSSYYLNTQGTLQLGGMRIGSTEPIDLASGHYYYDATDLVIGSGSLPRGITFARHYHGVRRNQRDPLLGYGWNHSLNIRVSERSEAEATLGRGTMQDTAAAFIGIHAVWDILKNRKVPGRPHDYLAAMLVANWTINQLTQNTAAVSLADRVLEFRKQPDGTYLPPSGSTATLEKSAATGNLYLLRERHGNTYTFDADLRLQTVTDLWGKSASFTYTGTGADKRLTTVTDCYNRSITLNYEAAAEAGKQRIASVTDSTGRSVGYRYDVAGNPAGFTNPAGKDNLTQVIDADVLNTWLVYDDQHRVLRLLDHGHTTNNDRTIAANEYDTQSRVFRQQAYGKSTQTWLYRYAPGITVEQNPLGGTTTHRFDENGLNTAVVDALGNESLKYYDGQRRLVREVGPWTNGTGIRYRHSTASIYDPRHNLTRKDYDLYGTTERWEYSDTTDVLLAHTDPNGNVTRFSDHTAQFQPQTITDPTNVVKKIAYVPLAGADGAAAGAVKTEGVMIGGANVTKATYSYAANGYGNPTTINYPAHAGGAATSVNSSYTLRGDPLTTTDARNVQTTFSYNNRRQRTGATINHTDLGSLSTSSILDSAGHATSATNFRSITTTGTYSAQGKPLTTTLPLPGSPQIINRYDDRDWLQHVDDPLTHQSSVEYDAAGRKTATVNPLSQRVELAPDELGRTLSATNVLSHTSSTSYGFYQNGDLPLFAPAILPDDNRLGDLTESIDPIGRHSYRFMDSLGNRRQLYLPTGNDGSYSLWQFTYDAAGRPLKTIRPTGGEFAHQYDDAGRLKKAIQPSGNFTELNYDSRDFVDTSLIKKPNGGNGIKVLGYTHQHDGSGNLLSLTEDTYNVTGTAVADTQAVARTYDNQGRVRTFTDVFGQVIGYRYDQNGNLKQMLYPDATPATWADNPAVTYTYDELDRLKTVTDWSSRVTTYTWDAAGRLTGIQRPNFTTRTITPDAAGQTLSIMERTGAGRALLYLRFGYDDAGRLQKRLVAPPLPKGVGVQAWSSSYTGDNRFSRLNYDNDGNQGEAFRLKGENPTLSWQLSPLGVWTPQYPSTVMLNAEQGEHVWNVKNQLLEVRHYSPEMGEMKPVTQCRYDPEGRLVKVTSGRLGYGSDPTPVPTWELRHTTLTVSPISPGGLSQVIVRESPPRFGAPDAPRVVTRYVYGLGLLYEVGADDSAHYYHGDQVGSTLAMTDDSGKVEARFEYSPYGVLTRSKIESWSSAAFDTPFLFCGESGCMTDASSGLVHMRARWYNPWLCRFISEDPIQFKGGMNWYAYAGGDPVMGLDPSGLDVLYLYGDSHDPSDPNYFQGAASSMQSEYNVSVMNSNISGAVDNNYAWVMPGRNTSEVVAAATQLRNEPITQVYWLGHSGDLWGDARRGSPVNVNAIPSSSFPQLESMHLYGCGTALAPPSNPNLNSAQKFANHFNVPVEGTNQSVAFGFPTSFGHVAQWYMRGSGDGPLAGSNYMPAATTVKQPIGQTSTPRRK
ncbi:MAG: RHS repeat-associated core domain-containing protein [Prosthecobacter sp.]|uniref:RHS repeat-associated core domain-containing protein n=1 Tax=Prosthecobacter sp. TaxID=1965333 RepID=UPI0038FD7A60